MIRAWFLAVAFAALSALPSLAQQEPDHAAIAERLVSQIALPASAALAEEARALRDAAPAACSNIDAAALRAQFNATWDAWMAIQHLRFGPLEDQDRALQLAFWPDSRGIVGRTVERLAKAEDPVVDDPETFAGSSVAGRGFYAMERLLYDDAGPVDLVDPYRCRHIAAVAGDILRLAGEIQVEWQDPWATLVRTAGEADNAVFLAPEEVTARVFATTLGAVEETAALRLGKPLGTFERRRSRLAEARRSGRSLRQIELVVDAVDLLGREVFSPDLDQASRELLTLAVARCRDALAAVAELGDLPKAIDGNAIRVEVLMQSVGGLANALRGSVGAGMGLVEGFNSADGD
ncbi:MAG: imelysin family protein [Pseudomonadota bacterium]